MELGSIASTYKDKELLHVPMQKGTKVCIQIQCNVGFLIPVVSVDAKTPTKLNVDMGSMYGNVRTQIKVMARTMEGEG